MPRPNARELRSEMIASAARLFSSIGYKATTLQDVAQSVGYSRPALLYHFKTKEALLGAMLEPALIDAERALGELLSMPDGVQRRLKTIGKLADLALAHRKTVVLLLTRPTELQEALKSQRPRQVIDAFSALFIGNNAPLAQRLSVVFALNGVAAAAAEVPDGAEEEARPELIRSLSALLRDDSKPA